MAENPHYNPARLLDTLQEILELENDRQLAAKLEANPSQISKIRNRRAIVAPALLISMHEETGISLRQLRALMGDYRPHTSPSVRHPLTPQLEMLDGIKIVPPRRTLLPSSESRS